MWLGEVVEDEVVEKEEKKFKELVEGREEEVKEKEMDEKVEVVVWTEGRRRRQEGGGSGSGGGRTHHVLHVGGSGIDSAPQLVVQLQDLLTVRPADGPAAPAAACSCCSCVSCAVHFLPVAAQKLPELRGALQEEGGGVSDAEEQDGEGGEQSGGGGGHPDTFHRRVEQ